MVIKYVLGLYCILHSCLVFADDTLKFKSAGNDNATIEFRLEKTKEFFIIGTFLNNAEDVSVKSNNKFEFKGVYREGLNVYDLTFKNVNKSKIEDLIKGSDDLWVIPSNGNVRMNKNPKNLRLYGIKMILQKS